jgi:hypothetical protein
VKSDLFSAFCCSRGFSGSTGLFVRPPYVCCHSPRQERVTTAARMVRSRGKDPLNQAMMLSPNLRVSLSVLSFMTTFSGSPKDTPRSSPSPQPLVRNKPDAFPSSSRDFSSSREHVPSPDSPTSSAHTPPNVTSGTTSSRPGSMIFQQPAIETTRDTEPELIPIFQYLSSHANKLYQEGYFLKLNDLDTSRSFREEVNCRG